MREDHLSAAIVEVQNGLDDTKGRRWLLAASVLHDQTGSLGDIIVITARRHVAAWALTVALVESEAGTKLALTPVVLYLGPKEAEKLIDPQRPELAFFAAWAMQHRYGPKARGVMKRVVDVTKKLPEPLQNAQLNAILAVLSRRMKASLKEAVMDPVKFELDPDVRAFKELMEAHGRAQGRAEALFAILASRNLTPTDDQRAAITACADPATLIAWIVKAGSASTVAEILAAAKPPPAPKRVAPKRAAPKRSAPKRAAAAKKPAARKVKARA